MLSRKKVFFMVASSPVVLIRVYIFLTRNNPGQGGGMLAAQTMITISIIRPARGAS